MRRQSHQLRTWLRVGGTYGCQTAAERDGAIRDRREVLLRFVGHHLVHRLVRPFCAGHQLALPFHVGEARTVDRELTDGIRDLLGEQRREARVCAT